MKQMMVAIALICLLTGCADDDHSMSHRVSDWQTITVFLVDGEAREYKDSHLEITPNLIYIQPSTYGTFQAFNRSDVDHVTARWTPND